MLPQDLPNASAMAAGWWGRLREGAESYEGSGQRYSAVRLMYSQPSGETWGSRLGDSVLYSRARLATTSPSFISRRARSPGLLRVPPVDAVQEIGELGPRARNRSDRQWRPEELALSSRLAER